MRAHAEGVVSSADAPATLKIREEPRTGARWWALVIGLACLAIAIGGTYFLLAHGIHGGPFAGSSSTAAKGVAPNPHPWGNLEIVPITISPPMEFVPEYAPSASHDVVWRFPNTSHSQLTQLLTSLGLAENLRLKLASLAALDGSINGVAIRPERELALALDPESRAKIYVALGQYDVNPDQVKAFRFSGDSAEQWFLHAGLSAATRKLVVPLIYRWGECLFFSDLRLIEENLSSPTERLTLIKTLARESTYLVKLKIDDKSDIDGLVNYWGRRGAAKDIRPILESLKNVDGGADIGVSHLLPAFARQRLYTYPVPPETDLEVKRDCHWTSFNFYSAHPDDRYCDIAEVVKALEQDYHRVYGDLKLGDLVLYFNGPTAVIHSAVYIAADLVYTKNGSLSTRPWMLMTLKDMKDYYPSLQPLDVRYYRRKDI